MINYFSFANILLVEGYSKIGIGANNIFSTGASFCYMQYLNINAILNTDIKTDIYYTGNCIYVCALIQNITKNSSENVFRVLHN